MLSKKEASLLKAQFSMLLTSPIPVLYQSGYLTIKGYDPAFQIYRLAYPNGEVRKGFIEALSRLSSIFAVNSPYIVKMDIKEIGKIIREKRKENLLDQSTVATLAGVGINTLTRIERGEGNPSFDVLHRVLTVLGLKIVIQ